MNTWGGNSRAATASMATGQAREETLLDRAFTRASGAQLVGGNTVRLLLDAAGNYPAWLEAIRGAQRTIHFENYFICEDRIGNEFAAALAEKAREGVKVRVIRDWVGQRGRASRKFWRAMLEAGVQLRCFNRPRFSSPVDWFHRDHRKVLAVDGRIGFVTGLCVGDMWVGDAQKGIEPWRDTGAEVRGPAVLDIERAFARVWAATGAPLDVDEMPTQPIEAVGDVAVRIVASEPGTSGLFRLDQLIAAAARRTLWLTDAYFAGVPPFIQALRSAAMDGVDVRLLVPGSSDIPLLRPLSQSGYRPLLEAGIRVFEWKGSMLHAKTAVADGTWARVGSSNLNVASWMGNYELDAVIEDAAFAASMERTYLQDLEYSTEIVLHPRRHRVITISGRGFRKDTGSRKARDGLALSGPGGSASRAAAGALRLGRTVGAALSEQRLLEATEGRVIGVAGILALGIGAIALLWPHVVAIPFAVLFIWIAIVLWIRAYTLHKTRRSKGLPRTRVVPVGEDSDSSDDARGSTADGGAPASRDEINERREPNEASAAREAQGDGAAVEATERTGRSSRN